MIVLSSYFSDDGFAAFLGKVNGWLIILLPIIIIGLMIFIILLSVRANKNNKNNKVNEEENIKNLKENLIQDSKKLLNKKIQKLGIINKTNHECVVLKDWVTTDNGMKFNVINAYEIDDRLEISGSFSCNDKSSELNRLTKYTLNLEIYLDDKIINVKGEEIGEDNIWEAMEKAEDTDNSNYYKVDEMEVFSYLNKQTFQLTVKAIRIKIKNIFDIEEDDRKDMQMLVNRYFEKGSTNNYKKLIKKYIKPDKEDNDINEQESELNDESVEIRNRVVNAILYNSEDSI